jgi:hypothetical protein
MIQGKTMQDQDKNWLVLDGNGAVLECFSGQTQAIDFAHRLQKQDGSILVIDLERCAVQLIQKHASYYEIAS